MFSKERCALPNINFTDADWKACIDQLEIPADIRDWVYVQIQRGQDYYSARIERLGLRGQRVLDAGCGMGNWSLALARWFDEVHALEITASRLDILEAICTRFNGRIHTKHGSIENLPYPDGWFDAVFCNGVIFLTDYQKSLKEFHRVLRSGGRVYISFNGLAWWKHLIHERTKVDPVNFIYGANALVNLLFRYLDNAEIIAPVPRKVRQQVEKSLLSQYSKLTWKNLFNRDARLQNAHRAYVSSELILPSSVSFERDVINQTMKELARQCTPQSVIVTEILRTFLESPVPQVSDSAVATYRRRAVRDLASRLIVGHSDYEIEAHTHSFEPEDMKCILSNIGFCNVVTSSEGTIASGTSAPAVTPIYSSNSGVFEVLGQRI
jgi:ubiquinone/menaquinone biosynthesis C-methylase UbiE